jgi:hypothetical protein
MNTQKSSAITHSDNIAEITHVKGLVYKYFQDRPLDSFTAKDVATDLQINSVIVNCRISELLRDGLLMPVGTIKKNKSTFNKFMYAPEHERERLVREMLLQDYKSWLKKGEKFSVIIDEALKAYVDMELENKFNFNQS